MLACFNIQFTSVYGNQVFLFFLSLLILVAWVLRVKSTENRMIILGSAVAVYAVLYCFVSFINKHVMDGERELEAFKNTDLLIYEQSGFGIGSGPYLTIGGGKTYLWGLLFKEEFSTTIYGEGPPPISGAFTLPKELKDPRGRDCWLWEEKGWLFDFDAKMLFKLKKRKHCPLSQEEKAWKQSWEKQLNARISLGKGTSDIEELFQLPTTIYLTLDFEDTNYVTQLDNQTIEELTEKLAVSLKPVLEKNNAFTTVETYFVTEDNRRIYVDSRYKFDENQQYKIGRYDLEINKLIPNLVGKDYIKFLYVPRTYFLAFVYYTKHRDEQEISRHSLSSEWYHIGDIGPVHKTGTVLYKGMKCEVFERKNHWKIQLKNGYLTNTFQYIMYNGELVEVTLNYACYKTNDKFTYGEVVDKLTYKNNSDDPEDQYYNYVSRDYLKFNYETKESVIKCVADTTSFPWKITYTTAITQPQFMYLYKELPY